jgi:outer membrane lipoprotein-sorting protein
VPVKATDVEFLNVDVYTDSAMIRDMSFALKDGTLVKIEVSSMKLTPKVSDEAFKPQTVFDSSWIVTDLR